MLIEVFWIQYREVEQRSADIKNAAGIKHDESAGIPL